MVIAMQRVLFITRKQSGIGGMERLNEDLWRAIQTLQPSSQRVRPWGRGDVTFPARAFFAALTASRVHLGDAALAPLGACLALLGKRVSLTACGLDVIYPRSWYQWFLRRSLPHLSKVHCISRATAGEVRRRGVSSEKIVVLPCGVWTLPPWGRDISAPRGRSDAPPRLLTVGRLIPRKGIAWFLAEVWPILQGEFPGIQCTIIGSGKEENSIKKLVHERGFTDVDLRGSLTDPERDAVFLESDLFVMPNVAVPGDMEGFGIVCIEAASRGLPVVASRLEGITDAVREGMTGRFFTPGDARDAARVITEMLRNPLDPELVAHAARTHYSWDALLPQYRDVLFS